MAVVSLAASQLVLQYLLPSDAVQLQSSCAHLSLRFVFLSVISSYRSLRVDRGRFCLRLRHTVLVTDNKGALRTGKRKRVMTKSHPVAQSCSGGSGARDGSLVSSLP